ncbi:Ras-like GTP-binding protein RYL2 [Penicillium angulare]|uniref:Ras-like GTP-binding protein RYL2 n=1 Tax=Penicillium angulare TaxID=116970 RepID=UPI002540C18C|nr:Ras-like GTP-binding protein RYL2 [Penicillium angulare]KAJ5261125.1 Ras-like GTP-binding protein RYL2 [Penicillium angulare]
MSSSLEAKIVVLGAQGVGKTSLVHRYVRNAFNPSTTTSTVGASFITKRVIDTTSDTTVRLQIWDTAGQERFRSISRLYYRGAHACLLCYDITDENSFQEMAGWLRELRKNLCDDNDSDPPLVIHVVGTKSDIVAIDPSKRRVPFERTIAYVAEQLYPSRASTPPPTAGMGMGMGGIGIGFGSGVFGNTAAVQASSAASGSAGALQSPDSKRSSAFWGQEIGWDCCHEISAKDGEGIDEVFRVIARKLVEQRNKRDADAAASLMGTPFGDIQTPFPSAVTEGGSFRLGYGDKRRSWLGLATPVVGEVEEAQVMQSAKRKGRCC